jgi:hypothetical protein
MVRQGWNRGCALICSISDGGLRRNTSGVYRVMRNAGPVSSRACNRPNQKYRGAVAYASAVAAVAQAGMCTSAHGGLKFSECRAAGFEYCLSCIACVIRVFRRFTSTPRVIAEGAMEEQHTAPLQLKHLELRFGLLIGGILQISQTSGRFRRFFE